MICTSRPGIATPRHGIALVVLMAMAVSFPSAAAPRIAFALADDSLDITVDGHHFARYVWKDAALSRPYFMHLTAPGGEQVTRNFPPDPVADKGNDDHGTFHPGVWLAFGDINGADYWRLKAPVRHVRFPREPSDADGRGGFTVLNRYETPEGGLVCEERCQYTIEVRDWGVLLRSESVFSSPTDPFAFGDQEEMGLGIRLATDLTVRHGGGHIVNSKGGQDEAGTWGESAKWCAGYGQRGGATVGAIVMPDPRNVAPSWFHSRDYGLIVANPFGKKAMTAPRDPAVPPASTPVARGEALRFGCAIGFFASPERPALDAIYADYIQLLDKG